MVDNYKVVIYRNKKHYKKLYTTKKYITAYRHYKKLIDESKYVHFPQKYDHKQNKVSYEIALLGRKGKQLIGYQTKSDYFIKKIHPYYIEEKFIYKNKNQLITFNDIIQIINNDADDVKTCVVSNNNLIISYSLSDRIELFTLKNKKDADRLFDVLKDYVIVNNLGLILFFDYYSHEFKQNLYEQIQNNLNIKKEYLYKTQTD